MIFMTERKKLYTKTFVFLFRHSVILFFVSRIIVRVKFPFHSVFRAIYIRAL